MTLPTLSNRRALTKTSHARYFESSKIQELQHFAELGRLSASLLHEISNPLSAAMLHLELSNEESPTICQVRRDIQLIRRYVESARQQVRLQSDLTAFGIRPQIDQLKRVVVPLARKASVTLEFSAIPSCKLYGDPVRFQQLLANLIANAIDAYNEIGDYSQACLVRVEMTFKRRWLVISVTDWGKGIPAPELKHVFEPFYTTKGDHGRGLGIGLSIVRDYVVNDFNGSIRVSSSRRHGTQFSVKLLAQNP